MSTPAQALAGWARERPRALALLTGEGQATSWAELDRWVGAAAAQISSPGEGGEPAVVSGDTVVVLCSDTWRDIVWFHAVWRVGAVVAPAHAGAPAAEVSGVVQALDPVRVLRGGAMWPEAVPHEGNRPLARSSADSEDPLVVIWTSGTSGKPRGVVLPARSLAHNARASAARLDLGPDDRWLCSLSLAHVGGLAMLTRATHLGSALVHVGKLCAVDLEPVCSRLAVTHLSLVPTMLTRLVEAGVQAPVGLRAVLVGGAGAAPSVVNAAVDLSWPVALTYGLTEAGSQVATATPEEVRAAQGGHCGRPLDGVDVRLSDDGEIQVRGPTLGLGTVGISGGSRLEFSEDGWLRTGDLGAFDSVGYLRVVGRRGAHIITGGVNVDPAHVEAALVRLDGVLDALVFGIPDPEWGERVVAVLVAQSSGLAATTRRPGDPTEWVRETLRSEFATPKIPKQVAWVDALPLNRNGKPDRIQAARGWVEANRPGP